MNNPIPNRLFNRNRANLAAQLPSKSVAVFTANEPMPRNGDEFYPFRQQSDFFYLTGINEENAFLLIAPDYPDEAMREILFIEPYDEVKAMWQGEMLDAQQASELSGIKTVKGSDAFWMTLNDIVFSGYGDTIFLNSYEYPKYECVKDDMNKKARTFQSELLTIIYLLSGRCEYIHNGIVNTAVCLFANLLVSLYIEVVSLGGLYRGLADLGNCEL